MCVCVCVCVCVLKIVLMFEQNTDLQINKFKFFKLSEKFVEKFVTKFFVVWINNIS